MIGTAVAIALTLQPAQPVNDIIPGPEDIRSQIITKAEGEKDWPFVDNDGRLSCMPWFGHKQVFFSPGNGSKGDVGLDANPLGMMIVMIGRKDIFLPVGSPEEIIRRIAPFVAMGQMLCKQNKGSVIPSSEL